MRRPRTIVALLFCSECGRDDRYRVFTGKGHFVRGKRCSGTPRVVKYALVESDQRSPVVRRPTSARPWRLWVAATHNMSSHAIPGFAYVTPEAAANGLAKWFPTGKNALGMKVYVADVDGKRSP